MSVPGLYHEVLEEWLDIGLNAGSFGGALFTAEDGRSTVSTVVGDPPVDEERFSLPGVPGEFSHDLGTRGRPITVEGVLRLSAAGRTAVMNQRDLWRSTPGSITYYDDDDVEYLNCRLVMFEIGPKARISDGDLMWLMPYTIELVQLEALRT